MKITETTVKPTCERLSAEGVSRKDSAQFASHMVNFLNSRQQRAGGGIVPACHEKRPAQSPVLEIRELWVRHERICRARNFCIRSLFAIIQLGWEFLCL